MEEPVDGVMSSILTQYLVMLWVVYTQMNFLAQALLEANTTKIQAIHTPAILNTMVINKTSMIPNILQVIQEINYIIVNLLNNSKICTGLNSCTDNET